MTETNAGQGSAKSLDDAAAGLEDLAGLISFHIGGWEEFGYEQPPPGTGLATIPPLGERSANAIRAGHRAVDDIDQLIARLHEVRAQLVSELRQDEDMRAARVDAMLAGRRDTEQDAPPAFTPPCPRCGTEAPHIAWTGTDDSGGPRDVWQCTGCGHEWSTPREDGAAPV